MEKIGSFSDYRRSDQEFTSQEPINLDQKVNNKYNLNMNRAGLLFLIITLFITNVTKAQQKSKPNILFIAIDDFKPLTGSYGNVKIKTPNIDRLAKMGTVFLNNHCQQSVCGPSRASLLTGLRPDVTKFGI